MNFSLLMDSTMPSVSQSEDNAVNGNVSAKSLSLLKRVHKTKQWMKEYVTDSGVLLLKETKSGNVDKVVDLLCRGAPFITDCTGVSALHFAAYNNSVEITELLLNSGMMRDLKNKVDRTALHIASQKGHTDIVRSLLTYGADPDIVDVMHMSALHWAVENQNEECVKLLLKYGARLGKVDCFGRTPLDIAVENNYQQIIYILENKSKIFDIPHESGKIKDNLNANLEIGDAEKMDVSLTEEDKTEESKKGNEPKNQEKEEQQGEKPQFSTQSKSSHTSNPSYITIEDDTLEMLKEHGIQMLEPDKVTTVHSAVESGQKVVLTEAGKLALDSIAKGGAGVSTLPTPNKKMLILQNGQKRIKINTGQLTSFSLDKDRGFLKNLIPSTSMRYFEGKTYSIQEDSILKTKLQQKINKLRSEAKLLDIFSKRKFRQANLYQEQLLSLVHFPDKEKENETSQQKS